MRAASAAWCRRGRHTYYAIHQRHQDSSSNPCDCLVYSGNHPQGCAAIEMKPQSPRLRFAGGGVIGGAVTLAGLFLALKWQN